MTPQELRDVTGAPIAMCVKALEIGEGDTRRALMWLYHHDRAIMELRNAWETCEICAQEASRTMATLKEVKNGDV